MWRIKERERDKAKIKELEEETKDLRRQIDEKMKRSKNLEKQLEEQEEMNTSEAAEFAEKQLRKKMNEDSNQGDKQMDILEDGLILKRVEIPEFYSDECGKSGSRTIEKFSLRCGRTGFEIALADTKKEIIHLILSNTGPVTEWRKVKDAPFEILYKYLKDGENQRYWQEIEEEENKELLSKIGDTVRVNDEEDSKPKLISKEITGYNNEEDFTVKMAINSIVSHIKRSAESQSLLAYIVIRDDDNIIVCNVSGERKIYVQTGLKRKDKEEILKAVCERINYDDLRPEYNLGELTVRKVGPDRSHFTGNKIVVLDEDLEDVFPDHESVNSALRQNLEIRKLVQEK